MINGKKLHHYGLQTNLVMRLFFYFRLRCRLLYFFTFVLTYFQIYILKYFSMWLHSNFNQNAYFSLRTTLEEQVQQYLFSKITGQHNIY